MRLSVSQIAATLLASFRRFPIPALCALGAAILTADFWDLSALYGSEMQARAIAIAVVAFFLTGAGRLVAEGLRPSMSWLADLTGCFLAVGLGLFLWQSPSFAIASWFLIGFSVALVFVGTAWRGPDEALWQFDFRICTRTFLGAFAGLTVLLALLGTLAAIEMLFERSFEGVVYSRTAAMVCLFFSPLFVLAGVPRSFRIESEAFPRALRVFLTYICVPLLALYGGILYLYAAKIVFAGSLPDGGVAWLGLAFLLPGLVLWLAVRPISQERASIAFWFSRLFFPVALVPAALVLVAIWVRIGAYGLTEERIVVALALVWFVLCGLGAVFWRRRAVTVLLGSFALLALVAGIGPYSAWRLSADSQLQRLERLVSDIRALPEGADPEQKSELKSDLESVLYYLEYSGKGALLEARFPALLTMPDENFGMRVDALTERLGLVQQPIWQTYSLGGLFENNPLRFDLHGAQTGFFCQGVLEAYSQWDENGVAPIGLPGHPNAVLVYPDIGLNVSVIGPNDKAPVAEFDLAGLLPQMKTGKPLRNAPVLKPENGPGDWRLVILSLAVQGVGDAENMSVSTLYAIVLTGVGEGD